MENFDIAALSNELTYRRYLMSNSPVRQYFKELNIPEYVALHIIADKKRAAPSGKTYLKDLADQMQIPVRKASRIVGALRDRGFLNWAHDGDGYDGTYVTMTDSGTAQMQHQEAVIKDFYGRVIEQFGRDNIVQLLQLMQQLDSVMNSELDKVEVDADGTDASQ
ncbi:MAG: MarR family transcriptional regulator [Candidatus Onthomonas sp.]